MNFHLLPIFYYSISNSPHQVVLVLLPQHELRYMVHPLDDLFSHPQLKRNRRISWSMQNILTLSLLYQLKIKWHLIPTLVPTESYHSISMVGLGTSMTLDSQSELTMNNVYHYCKTSAPAMPKLWLLSLNNISWEGRL